MGGVLRAGVEIGGNANGPGEGVLAAGPLTGLSTDSSHLG